MEITKTQILSDKLTRDYTLVIVADLHNRPYEKVLTEIEKTAPDYILIPGDLTDNLNNEHSLEKCAYGLSFLEKASRIAPAFYSVGNHERRINARCRRFIEETGAVLLDNETVRDKEITFGGLSTGLFESRYGPTPPPNLDYLKSFARQDGFRLLLCHHPEYYPEHIRETDIELTVSGHAHGGQWQFFGQGIYAPGQGLFPKYTAGLHEGRLYVSRGLANTCAPIPRLFNRRELAVIKLKAK